LNAETIADQVKRLNRRGGYHVHLWGSAKIPKEMINLFQGRSNGSNKTFGMDEQLPDSFAVPATPLAPYLKMHKMLKSNPELRKDKKFMLNLVKLGHVRI
jgi:hypothetical protein